jgi:hypothetical protein
MPRSLHHSLGLDGSSFRVNAPERGITFLPRVVLLHFLHDLARQLISLVLHAPPQIQHLEIPHLLLSLHRYILLNILFYFSISFLLKVSLLHRVILPIAVLQLPTHALDLRKPITQTQLLSSSNDIIPLLPSYHLTPSLSAVSSLIITTNRWISCLNLSFSNSVSLFALLAFRPTGLCYRKVVLSMSIRF